MTQCQTVLEVTVADCSTQLVQRGKTLAVRTLVVCVVARSGDCCRTEVVFVSKFQRQNDVANDAHSRCWHDSSVVSLTPWLQGTSLRM